MKRRSFGAADADGDEMAADDAGTEEMAMDAAEPMMLQAEAESAPMEEPVMQAIGRSATATSVSSGATSTLFAVLRAASIPSRSDGQPHKLVIGAVDVAPTFAYKSTPRAAAAAFLTAAGRNDSPYPLLPGPVRVFLDGAFTTTSNLPLVPPGDTLSLGLGIDPGIRVTSEAERSKEESRGLSVLGTEARRRAVTRRCVLRNSKQVAVDVQVTDVFPRSDHKELKVTLSDRTSQGGEGGTTVAAEEDAERGTVTWQVHLPPGTEQTLTATHRIEWPKGKEYVQRVNK